jgi:hypothetical protein
LSGDGFAVVEGSAGVFALLEPLVEGGFGDAVLAGGGAEVVACLDGCDDLVGEVLGE